MFRIRWLCHASFVSLLNVIGVDIQFIYCILSRVHKIGILQSNNTKRIDYSNNILAPFIPWYLTIQCPQLCALMPLSWAGGSLILKIYLSLLLVAKYYCRHWTDDETTQKGKIEERRQTGRNFDRETAMVNHGQKFTPSFVLQLQQTCWKSMFQWPLLERR